MAMHIYWSCFALAWAVKIYLSLTKKTVTSVGKCGHAAMSIRPTSIYSTGERASDADRQSQMLD